MNIFKWRLLLAVSGVLFLGISAEHFWTTSTTPTVVVPPKYDSPKNGFLVDIPESRLARRGDETTLEYVSRVSKTVHDTTYLCLPSEGRTSMIERTLFRSYPASYRQGLLVKDRFYCGLCHQKAYILGEILRKNGIDATVLGITGHVVLQITIDGELYIADADYGTVPFRYSDDDTILASSVNAVYTQPWANRKNMLSFYLSRDDNTPYYGTKELDSFAEEQRSVLYKANILAYTLLMFGIFLITLAFYVGRFNLTNLSFSQSRRAKTTSAGD